VKELFATKDLCAFLKKSHLFSQQREQKAAHNMYKTRNGFNLFVLQKHTFFGPSFRFFTFAFWSHYYYLHFAAALIMTPFLMTKEQDLFSKGKGRAFH